MVVTLHCLRYCDGLRAEKAVRWNAKVILSVPCCQHEVNKQMKSELFAPVFHYGIIKERMAALYTDAPAAEVLESYGIPGADPGVYRYGAYAEESFDPGGKTGKRKENREAILKEIHTEPTLYRLLMEEK